VDHESARFRSIILANLDAAHNLAWWLSGNDHDAADIVQEAYLKASRAFHGFRGGDSKSWFLAIVRTTALDRGRKVRRERRAIAAMQDVKDAIDEAPLTEALARVDRVEMEQALNCLPDPYREVIVLREIEGLGYAQIALVIEAPIGTVMSRLSRARDALAAASRRRGSKE
jgi:RNA polymerase sigma-70 factor (ECF subfamily)